METKWDDVGMHPTEDYAKNECKETREMQIDVDVEDESTLNPKSTKKRKLALTQEAVLGERLLEVITPCSEVGVCVRLEVPAKCSCESTVGVNEIMTYSLIYAAVGKSSGSHPMFFMSGSW